MSSAEEEAEKRNLYKQSGAAAAAAAGGLAASQNDLKIKRKHKHRKISLVNEPVQAPFTGLEDSEYERMSDDAAGDTRLKALTELLAEQNYMANNKDTGVPSCVFAARKSDFHASSSSVADVSAAVKIEAGTEVKREKKQRRLDTSLATSCHTPEQVQAMHTLQLAVNPWTNEAFKQSLARIPQPKYFDADCSQGACSEADLQARMREGRASLKLQLADHESSIFAQAGRFQRADGSFAVYPACMKGKEECIGYTNYSSFPGLTEPIVFTAVMFPNEVEHGSSSTHIQRMCIACSRYLLVSHVVLVRRLAMRGGPELLQPDESRPFERKCAQILQLYRNLCDMEGGYSSEYMVHPSVNEPIIDPMARLNRTRLRAYRDASQGGRWCIDQSAIVWKPAALATPRTGESVQDF